MQNRVKFDGGAERESLGTMYSDVDIRFIANVHRRDVNGIGLTTNTAMIKNMASELIYDLAMKNQQMVMERIEIIVSRICLRNGYDSDGLLIAIADTMTKGAEKYGRDNWKKKRDDGSPSIPVACFIDHAIDHVRKHVACDTSEPHVPHALCNLYMAWWHLNHEEAEES